MPTAWCNRCGCSATRSSAWRGTTRRCPYLEEAANLFAQLEDRCLGSGNAERHCARILERTSPDAAVEAWNAVLALHRRRGDVKSELDAREGLARALRAKGPDEAIPAFESALALAATIGDRAREAAIGNVLGILEWQRGHHADALRHYESVLSAHSRSWQPRA